MRTLRDLRFGLLLMACAAAACSDPLSAPDPLSGPSPSRVVVISQIHVTNITDQQLFNDLLEVEVHLWDAETGSFLGCSGQDSGLRYVEHADTLYQVRGYFQKPPDGGDKLRVDDIRGRRLYLQVVEDDANPCPAPPDIGEWDDWIQSYTGDDPIATSQPFSADELMSSRPLVLSFGNVVRLVLETEEG